MADTINQYSFIDYDGLALFWSNVKRIIENNELVTASSLTDLDTRVDDLEELTSNITNMNFQRVTDDEIEALFT